MRFVSYLRVSTSRQGRSGLGIEAQRAAVASFLSASGADHLQEFVEVETGKRSDRPELNKALAMCRLHRAVLVVAKVDRLTRSSSFLHKLLDAKVDVRFCDLPQIEGPTGRFLLQQMVAVAELEAAMISARTKAALQACKQRGTKLGGFRGRAGNARDTALARSARKLSADGRAWDINQVIKALDPAGSMSLRTVARALSARGIPTPRGRGEWTAAAVQRVKERAISSL